jgi:DNA-binding NarL/FixJ family response regulator
MKCLDSVIETKCIRVVLIDDQQLFRTGIKSLIGNDNGIRVVGEAGSPTEALAAVKHEQPDVILLDQTLHGECGLDLLPGLLAAAENAKILILTETRDAETHRKAVRLGAKGLVSKDSSFAALAKAIERVHAGEVWLDRSMTAAVLEDLTRRKETQKLNPEEAKIVTLTGREREVITSVGEGLKNKQIGERLFISDVTVHHHLTSIYSKLEVSDRLELVIYAYRHGLVPIPR